MKCRDRLGLGKAQPEGEGRERESQETALGKKDIQGSKLGSPDSRSPQILPCPIPVLVGCISSNAGDNGFWISDLTGERWLLSSQPPHREKGYFGSPPSHSWHLQLRLLPHHLPNSGDGAPKEEVTSCST